MNKINEIIKELEDNARHLTDDAKKKNPYDVVISIVNEMKDIFNLQELLNNCTREQLSKLDIPCWWPYKIPSEAELDKRQENMEKELDDCIEDLLINNED